MQGAGWDRCWGCPGDLILLPALRPLAHRPTLSCASDRRVPSSADGRSTTITNTHTARPTPLWAATPDASGYQQTHTAVRHRLQMKPQRCRERLPAPGRRRKHRATMPSGMECNRARDSDFFFSDTCPFFVRYYRAGCAAPGSHEYDAGLRAGTYV